MSVLISVQRKVIRAALLCIFLLWIGPVGALADNDWVYGRLRQDLPEIQYAQDYKLTLQAGAVPGGVMPDDFAAAWLSVDLEPLDQGFTQVGLIAYSDGLRWFAYSQSTAGITCLRGTSEWGGLGCRGLAGDIVGLDQWYVVELVHILGQTFWTARVYDVDGTAYDVMRIWSDATQIYNPAAVSEEGYLELQDPFLNISYWHWHPQYMIPGAGFKDWPMSELFYQGYSYIQVVPNTICPAQYGATLTLPDFNYDPWAWFAGTGGQVCSQLMFYFPNKVYLPVILQ